jgi:hypothetical protein
MDRFGDWLRAGRSRGRSSSPGRAKKYIYIYIYTKLSLQQIVEACRVVSPDNRLTDGGKVVKNCYFSISCRLAQGPI